MLNHKIERVTPAVAEEWLATMADNRNLSTANVNKYAQLMRDGLWIFDGSPIRFDEQGHLVDGQHRLWAIIEAQHEADFLVVRGVQSEAMAVMDTGKSRSFSDILSIYHKDIPSVAHAAAVTNGIWRWVQGYRGNLLRSSNKSTKSTVPPNAVLLKFFEENKEEILQITRDSRRISQHLRGVTITVVGIAMWAFVRIDEDDAADFWRRLETGIGLDEGSPILSLRSYIGQIAIRNPGETRPTLETVLGAVLKAWNAYRSGKELKRVQWRRGGANPEPFPEPR